MRASGILSSILSVDPDTSLRGLFVLTSGPIPPNPAELIGSDQMRKLLCGLAVAFDYIVIDSPPVASFTDGVLLGSMVDGVLLVVHGGRSSRDGVRRSQRLLLEVGAKVSGVGLYTVRLRSLDCRYYQ